ncbi:hypothetical protein [Paenibacillus sp. PastM-2]|nr:hypothetical protein [Paenibacillus sp. PastM-2]MDF9847834.1 hypothetical protein [Paenibacillus sp. PastM-2]
MNNSICEKSFNRLLKILISQIPDLASGESSFWRGSLIKLFSGKKGESG